jgi:hypothetical protein
VLSKLPSEASLDPNGTAVTRKSRRIACKRRQQKREAARSESRRAIACNSLAVDRSAVVRKGLPKKLWIGTLTDNALLVDVTSPRHTPRKTAKALRMQVDVS